MITNKITLLVDKTKDVVVHTKLKYDELTTSNYLIDVSQLGLRVKTIHIGFRMVFTIFLILVAFIMASLTFIFVGYNKLDELHKKLEDRILKHHEVVADKVNVDFSEVDTNFRPHSENDVVVLDFETKPSANRADGLEVTYFEEVNKLVFDFKNENQIHNLSHMDLDDGATIKKILALNSKVCELFMVEFSKIDKLQHVDDFYQKDLIEAALMEQIKYGIPASITLSQAADESSYGRSDLAVQANNYFGIKYNEGQNYDYVTHYTGEELTASEYKRLKKRGVALKLIKKFTHKGTTYYKVKIPSKFRKYDTWWHSVRDHSEFLAKRPGYQKIFANNGNWRVWVKMFRPKDQGGVPYATSTSKSVRLGKIIERYKLYLLDVY